MPFKIYADESTSLGSESSDTLQYEIAEDMPFTIHKMYIKSTGTFKITEISDAEGNQYLSGVIYNDQIQDAGGDLTLIADVEPIVVAHRLYIKITDTSVATNNVYIALFGVQGAARR